MYIHLQEPTRIILKETRTQRLAGRKRKVVIKREEVMYVPLLETLQSLLNNKTVFEQVHMHLTLMYPIITLIVVCKYPYIMNESLYHYM